MSVETAPKNKRNRGPRKNWERDYKALRTYVETKLEVLKESDNPSESRNGQITALESVLARLQ